MDYDSAFKRMVLATVINKKPKNQKCSGGSCPSTQTGALSMPWALPCAAHTHPGKAHSGAHTLTEMPLEFICRWGITTNKAVRFDFVSNCSILNYYNIELIFLMSSYIHNRHSVTASSDYNQQLILSTSANTTETLTSSHSTAYLKPFWNPFSDADCEFSYFRSTELSLLAVRFIFCFCFDHNL